MLFCCALFLIKNFAKNWTQTHTISNQLFTITITMHKQMADGGY